jgi:23S rRNA (guanine745-N1)-methyltransferase
LKGGGTEGDGGLFSVTCPYTSDPFYDIICRMKNLFICPVCGHQLEHVNNSCVCANGHSFDISKEGYVNLLLSSDMHSKNPGDTKQMVSSRRAFLDGGYYSFFRDAMSDAAADYTAASAPVLLDAGAGEGYYTKGIKDKLCGKNKDASVFGTDISKFACAKAAKRYKDIFFAVCSNFALPVGDASCDILTCCFSPLCIPEYARVLKKGGVFVYAVPGPSHLIEMKDVLYERPYLNEEKTEDYDGFAFIDKRRAVSRATVKAESLPDLFSMTPYLWRTPQQGIEKLNDSGPLDITFEFDILIYGRR